MFRRVRTLHQFLVEANKPQPANVSTDLLATTRHANPSDRTKRVKDAKAEAQKEIDEYRQKKEEEYKKFESEVCASPLDNYVHVSHVYSKAAATRKQKMTPTRTPRPR